MFMKKIIRMAAMLAVAGAALLTSCTKDYGQDITDLQNRVSNLEKTIEAIQGQINNGAILTAVNKTANGISVVTTNGTYEITNGKDGAPGKDGSNGAPGKDGSNGAPGKDGSVWTIGDDGYWYCDGKKSDYAKGSTVTVKDGVLYIDGKATEIASKGITAVWNAEKGALELYGVKGGQGEDGYVCISLDGKLKSLVFDPKAYVDGVEAILVSSFKYTPLSVTNIDDSKEIWAPAKNASEVSVSPAVTAEYFVNPKSAVITDKDKLEFVVNNDPFKVTRATASKDFDVKAEFVSYEAGKLKVKVLVNGKPAVLDTISVVALKVTPADKATEAVVSDFATVYSDDLDDLVISDPKAEAKKKVVVPNDDEHYRTIVGLVDANAFNQTIAWDVTTTTMKDTKATCDTVVAYNSFLNLYGVVAAHKFDLQGVCQGEASADELAALGLTWDFAIVKNYRVGNPSTDQADFVTLKDGILTPRVYDTTGKASIGRSPIIRAKLMDGKNVVKVAYIKVIIVDESLAPAETPHFDLDVFTTPTSGIIGTFAFDCAKDSTLYTSVQQMNVKVYNELKMSKDVFHSIYDSFDGLNAPTDSIVVNGKKVQNIGFTREVITTNAQTGATHTIAWTMPKDSIWKYAGTTVYHEVKYYSSTSKDSVMIRLKADIDPIAKSYDILEPDFISNYWNPDKTIAYGNVFTPDKGETDPNKCTFVVDLNAPFVTEKGKILLNKAITDFEFFFCKKDVEAIKEMGGIKVKFEVKNNGTELWATETGKTGATAEMIAFITNGNSAVPFNTVTLVKTSDLGKKLLNSKDGKKDTGLYTYIGVTGYVCGDKTKPVTVTFKGQDHYQLNFLRPINIDTMSGDHFIDAVDMGEKGSYIEIKKLINPFDWRGRYFNTVENKVEIYANYWDYYGPFNVTVDTQNIKCDLGGKVGPLPATIKVDQVGSVTGVTPVAQFGYITYRNNGNNVDAFNMYVTVNVEYGWGVIETAEVKVPVFSTTGVDPNAQ